MIDGVPKAFCYNKTCIVIAMYTYICIHVRYLILIVLYKITSLHIIICIYITIDHMQNNICMYIYIFIVHTVSELGCIQT